MADDVTDTPQDDGLSKEFDDIVAHSDDGAVEVPVRHDTTPLDTVSDVQPPAPVETVTQAPVAKQKQHGSGGVMVLQWLSYAFWGWFGVAFTWLTGVVTAYFVSGNSVDVVAGLAYPLASVIVMGILAAVTDLIYARREPAQKVGGANAIMLIHVVLFVLIAVAAAVTAVFACISMLLNTDPSAGTDAQVIVIWTSVSTILLFALSAVRALFGGRKPLFRRIHWIAMAVFAVVIIVLSLVGPVAGVQSTKDDRIIEEGLPSVSNAIRTYVVDNDTLPTTLSQLKKDNAIDSSAAMDQLIDRGMVRYTPNVKPATQDDYSELYNYGYKSGKTYYYRLCVTYAHVKKSSGIYTSDTASVSGGGYESYLYVYSHGKGEKCYDMEAPTNGIVYPMDDTVTGASSSSSTTTK